MHTHTHTRIHMGAGMKTVCYVLCYNEVSVIKSSAVSFVVVLKAAKRHTALCDSGALSNTHTQLPNASHTQTHTHFAGQSAL